MKNLVATLAILAVSIGAHADFKDGARKARENIKEYEQMYRKEDTIVGRYLVRIFTQSTGPVATAGVNVSEATYDAALGAYDSWVKTDKCVSRAELEKKYPNHHAACFVDLAGGLTGVVVYGAGTAGMDVIKGAGDIATNLLYATGDGLIESGEWFNKTTQILPVGYALQVSGVVINAAGKVVEITFTAVDGAGRSMVFGSVNLVDNTAKFGRNLLMGDLKRASKGLVGTLPLGMCLIAEPFIGAVRAIGMLADAASSAVGVKARTEKPEQCSRETAKWVEGYINGDPEYQPTMSSPWLNSEYAN